MHFRVLLPKNTPLEQHRAHGIEKIRAELPDASIHVSFETSLEPPDTHALVYVTIRQDENGREVTVAAKAAAKAVAIHFGLRYETHLVRSSPL